MGMRHKQIERKFDQIVDFSGIEEFIDTPVKRYSSGMNARLGFSVAAHLEPDVLIIDEVLAVGDMAFQGKAFGRIRDLANSGLPVVIVSHQLERVMELCTDAILLRKGEVAFHGTPADTIGAYVQNVDTAVARPTGERSAVQFDSLRALDDRPVVSGSMWTFRVEGRITDKLPDSVEPIRFRLRALMTGHILYVSGIRRLGMDLGPGEFSVDIAIQANLPPSNYLIEVAANDTMTQEDIAFAPSAMMTVVDSGQWRGMIQLNPEVRILTPA